MMATKTENKKKKYLVTSLEGEWHFTHPIEGDTEAEALETHIRDVEGTPEAEHGNVWALWEIVVDKPVTFQAKVVPVRT